MLFLVRTFLAEINPYSLINFYSSSLWALSEMTSQNKMDDVVWDFRKICLGDYGKKIFEWPYLS